MESVPRVSTCEARNCLIPDCSHSTNFCSLGPLPLKSGSRRQATKPQNSNQVGRQTKPVINKFLNGVWCPKMSPTQTWFSTEMCALLQHLLNPKFSYKACEATKKSLKKSHRWEQMEKYKSLNTHLLFWIVQRCRLFFIDTVYMIFKKDWHWWNTGKLRMTKTLPFPKNDAHA